MAQVANDSGNLDTRLLRSLNDLAKHAPRGVNHAVEFAGQYGIIAALVLLAGWCWWRSARRSPEAPAAVAGILWAGLAPGLALLLNLPIRALIQRPRPYDEHGGLAVLAAHPHDYSFVSDRATIAAALAVSLFMVSRAYGAVAIVLALAEGFTRVYLGVHYPTDVLGGFALGAATTLLLAPPALALLTAATRRASTTRAAVLVQAPFLRDAETPTRPAGRPLRGQADRTDLAA